MVKGHCKVEDAGGDVFPPQEAVATNFSPFSNQNFDTENHDCLIECYVHEIERRYFERNFILN